MIANQDLQLDELKNALNALTARLAKDEKEEKSALRRRKANHFKRALWPLYVGQVFQMAFGVLMIALGVAGWTQHRDGSMLMWSGIIVHTYGVACIVAAGILFGQLAGLNASQPVLELQEKLARSRKAYVIGGMVVGLAWWLFWIPFMATLADVLTRGQVDFYARMGGSLWITVAVGVAGLMATAWFHRWSRDPARPRLRRAMEDAVTGGTLVKAQKNLDELKAFDEI